MRRIYLLLFVSCMTFSIAQAQLTVTGGLTAQQLAENLAGPNIEVSNAVLTGSGVASGTFSGTNTNLGFESGVILSTGNVSSAPGPNNQANSSNNLNTAGTTQMSDLAGANSFDAITLEFDFQIQSNLIQFNYIFASEEYPEYAPPNNSAYNDVFAFYISGPGITGEENIALVPNTTSPVAINMINPVTNSQYYVDNTNGQTIQFDGFTTQLTAKKTNLTACQTYHLKLVIADVGDHIYNSAVFLQENSLVQGLVDVQTQTVNSDNIALEGCIKASFTFSFNEVSTQDRVINYEVAGTAVNGVDYAYIDNYLTIPAGDLSATIYVDAFSDGITEGQESVYIIYQPSGCSVDDTAYLYIDDAQSIDYDLNGTNLSCFEDQTGEININATGGFPPYTYHYAFNGGDFNQTQNNPITNLEAGEYNVQVYDSYGCKANALVVGGLFDAGTTFLPDGTGVTYEAPLEISGFNPGQTITDLSQILQICLTMEHSYLGDLQIRLESPSGESCILKEQNGGNSCDLGEPVATGAVDGEGSSDETPGIGYEYCFNATPDHSLMTAESANYYRDYTDLVGNSYGDNYLPAGSYSSFQNFNNLLGSTMNGTWKVFVTDQWALDNGYIFNWYISLIGDAPDSMVVLTQPNQITSNGLSANTSCGESNGSINISVYNGTEPYTFEWSNGATTEDVTGLSAGQYAVVISDANNCSTTSNYVVNNSSSIGLTYTSTSVSCFNGNNGSINITPSGGTAPYTFSWSNNETSQNISNLTAGTYTVSITDQAGCIYSQAITISQNPAISISLTNLTDEVCNTDNGSITVNASGGNNSYGYNWSNGMTGASVSNLSAGTYTLTVTDGNSCSASSNYTIINNTSNCSSFCYLDVEENNITSTTCGQNNGEIDIHILNATPPYLINWSNGATSEDLTNLNAGTYSVTVSDNNNCSATAEFIVTNNSGNLAIQNQSITDESCNQENGSISLSISGGALPYTYSWSNGATTQNISNLAAGNYTLQFTDGNGCGLNQAFEIASLNGSLNVSGTVSNTSCGVNNGDITQSTSGQTGTAQYAWSTGATSQSITGLAPGNYTCTITDNLGCSLTNSYTVEQNLIDISLASINKTNETCHNQAGAIDITCMGNGLTYEWSNGQTTQDLTGLSMGTYSCQITNGQGCTISTGDIIIVNSPGNLSVSNQLVSAENCNQANGAININVQGGTSPYSYSWSNGSTAEDLSQLESGMYNIVVTDANGCVKSHNVQVGSTQGNLEIQQVLNTPETCGNGAGSLNLTVSGGTEPIAYTWSNGADTEDLASLNAGTYTVQIQDASGCTQSNSYTVINNANNLQYTSTITNETCSNGTGEINLSVTGGSGNYTYLWNTGSENSNLTDLSSGNYTCTITDDAGCSIHTSTLQIGNYSNNFSASTIVSNANCSNNGAINLTLQNGESPFNISWSNNATTEDINGLSAGTYTFSVSDGNNCIVTGSATVAQTNGNLSYTQQISPENCTSGDGEISLSVSGGNNNYTYLWSNSETEASISGLSAGTYTCQITDGTGCSITTNPIQITSNTGSFSLLSIIPTDANCSSQNGSIEVEVTGGESPITYDWSNGGTTQDISSLASGIYSLTITDNNGCIIETETNVGVSSGTLGISQALLTHESCSNQNGAIQITTQGGVPDYSYQWSNGGTTEDLTNLHAGTYSVQVMDVNGCSTTANFTINNQSSAFTISNTNIQNEVCGSQSGSIYITTSGGNAPYNYSWSNGATTEDLSNLNAGSYTLEVTDTYGCSTSGTYAVINETGGLSLESTLVDETCGQNNGSISITTTGGTAPLSFTWDNGQETDNIADLEAGNYTLLLEDALGCTVDYSGTIQNITNGLSLALDTKTDETCGGSNGSIDVLVTGVSGTVTYLWSNGLTTQNLSAIEAGTYTLTATDELNCSVTITETIVNNTGNLALSFSNIGNESCNNQSGFIDVEFTGDGGYIYEWSNGQSTQDLTNLAAGSYTLNVTDINSCEFNQTFTVLNQNSTGISTESNISNSLCTSSNGSIDLTMTGGLAPYTYNWSTGAQTQDIQNLAAGNYSVTITDDGNCSTTESFEIVSQASNLGFTNIIINDNFCENMQGQITIYTNGTASAYYLNGSNMFGPSVSGLPVGSYDLTITDNYGCSVDSTVQVGNTVPFMVSSIVTNEICNNQAGSIDLTVNGSTVAYQWSNGATTEDLTGLTPGTYTVSITETGGWGCTDQQTFTIENIISYEIDGTVTSDYCNQQIGAINQDVLEGTDLDFAWSNGATTEDLIGIPGGDYTCVVTDNIGCQTTYSYNVETQTTGLEVNFTSTGELCDSENASIQITATNGSGNYGYLWSNGETNSSINGISSGEYNCIVTDLDDNCAFNQNVTVTDLDYFFAASVTTTGATCSTCNDGEVELVISNTDNMTYLWSNGATTANVSELLPGSYTLTITSPEGCDTTLTTIILNTADLTDSEGENYHMDIYPNPASDYFTINYFLSEHEDVIIEMTDLLGKTIYQETRVGFGELKMETADLPYGTYLVSIKLNDKKVTKRIVILK
jgi:subtilisin-like proprotein convertase family protein